MVKNLSPSFHALLIVGGNQPSRKKEALETAESLIGEMARPSSDQRLTLIEAIDGTIGIGKIRDLKRLVALKPESGTKQVVVVSGAETMTLEAQNALLKTLEEPPAETVIILTAAAKNQLPKTITSRCFIKEIKADDLNVENSIFPADLKIEALLTADLKTRFDLSEKNEKFLSDREAVAQLIDQWLRDLRNILKKEVTKGMGERSSEESLLKTLDRLLEVKSLLTETNVNVRLLIENFLLDLPFLPRDEP